MVLNQLWLKYLGKYLFALSILSYILNDTFSYQVLSLLLSILKCYLQPFYTNRKTIKINDYKNFASVKQIIHFMDVPLVKTYQWFLIITKWSATKQ